MRKWMVGGGALALLAVGSVRAQVTPAEGYTPPDDTPSIKVGTVIFTDYTYTDEPTMLDAAGNEVKPKGFNVTRAYINVTGNISHLFSFRVTPDITRETGVGSSLSGSLDYRLKYAYGQFNMDQWLGKGTWLRLGDQPTPYIDFIDSVYRYRFQGPTVTDREGFLVSADFGLAGHYNFPKNFGDVMLGIYNGEGYQRAEANNQQAYQIRATLRPLPLGGIFSGLRLTGFYDADAPVDGGERNRFVGALTFEHKYANAGFEWLDNEDQPLPTSPTVKSDGYSVWVTPRTSFGLEGLLRHDSLSPDKNVDGEKERDIAGVSWWWYGQTTPIQAALMLDYEKVDWDDVLAKPDEKRYALHALFQY
jgi:hypothetical protein